MINQDKALAAYLETGKGFYGSTVTATAYDAFKKGVQFAQQAVPALPVAWAVEWLKNNYQAYPNIASLTDAMLAAAVPQQGAQQLPPLPAQTAANTNVHGIPIRVEGYTSDQMREYARAALAAVPADQGAQEPVERGPWRYGFSEGRHFVESDDFTHDVRLYIDGDFAHAEDREQYGEMIAQRLNDAAPSQQVTQSPKGFDAEFLAKRLGRVAKLAGVPMPDMNYEDTAAVAGTILGSIASKLESQQDLQHDIERYVAHSTELATENERLRKEIRTLQEAAQPVASDELKTWPERIWMQHCDGAESLPTYPDAQSHEITWCQNQIHECDVAYVRADLAAPIAQQDTQWPTHEQIVDAVEHVVNVHGFGPLKDAAQPLHEQNARFAIDGAIAYGMRGTNPPPTEDHWLMEYWQIGQKLGQKLAQQVTRNSVLEEAKQAVMQELPLNYGRPRSLSKVRSDILKAIDALKPAAETEVVECTCPPNGNCWKRCDKQATAQQVEQAKETGN